jgi:hypothetical protein
MDRLNAVTVVNDSRFWDRFIEFMPRQGVKKPFDRWHTIRAKAPLAHTSDRASEQHAADDVAVYLLKKGRVERLKDWQFKQVVESLEVLFVRRLGLRWQCILTGANANIRHVRWNPSKPRLPETYR